MLSQILKRVPLYIFPLYLAFAEYFVREFLLHASDGSPPASISVVGPSIAAAGMVILFPVLIPKPPQYNLPSRIQAELAKHNVGLYSRADQNIISIAWSLLVILAGVWIWTLYLAHKNPPAMWHFVPVTVLIGGVAYILGVFLTELKGL